MKPTGTLRPLVVALTLFIAACASGGGADEARDRPVPMPPETPPVRTDPGTTVAEGVDVRLRNVDLDTVHAGRFDQGKMWTFEYPPMDYLRTEYGIEPDSAWFRKARLGTLRLPNCSASFVSPHGLVLTNHHCAREAVSQVSGEGENLLDEGFYARSLAEERAVEDTHVDQLVEIIDITNEVSARTTGLSGPSLVEARAQVLTDIGQEMLEARGGEDAGWVVEAISLYNDARFSAYVFRRYENIKLVMAPELQIGFFGGDPDNFTYPRYNLDFSFLRVYGDDGEPLDNDVWFQWSQNGAQPGEPIFIIGNPGSTSRLQTVDQLAFRRDVSDRALLNFVRSRMEILDEFVRDDPEVAERYDLRNSFFSLSNTEKAVEGQVRGLEDPAILARRLASQEELRDSIRADPELAELYSDIFQDMAELQAAKRENAAGFRAFLGLTAPSASSPTLHRALLAFQVLNAQRAGATGAQVEGLLERLRGVEDLPPEVDEAMVRARLEDFITAYGADAPWVREILDGRSPEGAAASIVANSALSDSAGAVQAVERGTLTPDDPALRVVRSYVPAFGAYQQAVFGDLQPREDELGRKIGLARWRVYGTAQPPDATFSLRLADGVVEGYDYNGTIAPPFTTFYGLYDHYYSYRDSYDPPSESPWHLPERWLEPPAGFDLATPLNFVSTADIIGGNSGSPVVNQFLEIVGVVFDGNIESLPGEYIYLPEFNRSVTVDARGILEALDDMYDMDRIVLELQDGVLSATEAEADRRRR